MSDFADFTVLQLVEAILGDLDRARNSDNLYAWQLDDLNMSAAMVAEIGRRDSAFRLLSPPLVVKAVENNGGEDYER